ncbi:hypothetical protein [Vibrio europaeus]|uniref:Uncharacterized protein n=1 Tax=Vibrio europaeus TaxID=300876 RepID=A0A178J3N1_9VIBR|nr:hypothetical protein [Vibrio europaeus]MDC5708435.1 hypothetical protein [Vibrio europaeus]MDC5713097.1 hypothetical protein [Vibrio europaeus]MDC5728132.1 hypothetical protein [Vibrio europaeus]MDC5733274.1 hypothetical protein [Vibrio europaeus]MDC5742349.1 hypothetical protein [Vibrio europaeus]
MARKTTLLSEYGCSLVLVEELGANGAVLSTSYEVIDVDGNIKSYSSKVAAKSAYANRVYEAEQRLGISSSPGMGM